MFTAKPKLNNQLDVRVFTEVAAAVNYLNEYNQMGDDVSKLQAEDWWLLGKLTGPEGVEFKNNKIVETK